MPLSNLSTCLRKLDHHTRPAARRMRRVLAGHQEAISVDAAPALTGQASGGCEPNVSPKSSGPGQPTTKPSQRAEIGRKAAFQLQKNAYSFIDRLAPSSGLIDDTDPCCWWGRTKGRWPMPTGISRKSASPRRVPGRHCRGTVGVRPSRRSSTDMPGGPPRSLKIR